MVIMLATNYLKTVLKLTNKANVNNAPKVIKPELMVSVNKFQLETQMITVQNMDI